MIPVLFFFGLMILGGNRILLYFLFISEVSGTPSTSEASASQLEETPAEIEQNNSNKNTPIS